MAGLIQSDKSIKGDTQKARVVSKKKPWRDLDLSLKIHPIRKDIIPLKDDVAIKNAVKNLLISNFYDRPFAPDKGANLKGLLFEPNDPITRISMREQIRAVIKKYEPRVAIQKIDISDTNNENGYRIVVSFRIKEYDSNESVEIILRRLR